jgi:hypothetical protein
VVRYLRLTSAIPGIHNTRLSPLACCEYKVPFGLSTLIFIDPDTLFSTLTVVFFPTLLSTSKVNVYGDGPRVSTVSDISYLEKDIYFIFKCILIEQRQQLVVFE